MKLWATLLVLLFAGFSWFLLQGIDVATGWLEAEESSPDRQTLDQAEFTAAGQGAVSLETTLEIQEASKAMPTRAPEVAETSSPLDLIAEAPTEPDTWLEIYSEKPARDGALPEVNRDDAAAEPGSPTPTIREPANPPEPATEAASAGAAASDQPMQPAATSPGAEAAASDPTRLDPSPAAESLISAPTAPEIPSTAASPEPEIPAAPEFAVELPATEPAVSEAPVDEPVQPIQAEAAECNIQRCTAAFRSFQASDCTYQPFEGPRRLCTVGLSTTKAPVDEPVQPVQAEAAQCNIQRCTAAFRSFQASDCTYQPYEGPRHLCPY